MDIDVDKLVDEIIKGNEDAFPEIVHAYLSPAYNFAYRLVGNADDATDIAQEAFLKAWKNIRKFKKGMSFKAWLFTIVRNSAIDLSRKKRIQVFSDIPVDKDDDSVEDNIPDTAPLPDELFLAKEEKERLRGLVENLPPIYREVLALRYDEEMGFEEIAEILGRSADTVRSQHRRALAMLRRASDTL